MTFSFSWADVARLAGGRVEQEGVLSPRRVIIDSRCVEAGDLFVALAGERRDGHDFLTEVARRGAAGALVSRVGERLPSGFGLVRVEETGAALQRWAQAHREGLSTRVIGVTGSNGKTTTKEILGHLLGVLGREVLVTRGNFNSQIGLPLMLLELEARHTHAVLEMGASAAGDLTRLAKIARPHVAVLTGIGRAHLQTFGSLEGVLAAKWELVESLGEEGIAFLNADDPLLMNQRKRARCSVVTFGRSSEADVRAENIRQDPQGVFEIVVGGARREVRLPMPGLFNVTNALAAVAVALWERGLLPEIAAALENFTPPPQRMQVRPQPDGSLFVLDAYNANPDSMSASLRSFVEAYPRASKVVVLGSLLELGEVSEEEHRGLGRLLASLPVERIFFVGPEGPWVRSGYDEAGGRVPFSWGEDRDKMRGDVAPWLGSGRVFLFKASRGVKLETLYESWGGHS